MVYAGCQLKVWTLKSPWMNNIIFVLGFNDMSTLVGHFVSSPREVRKEIEEIVKKMKEAEREERGTGMKVKKQKK